jgi:hypothetical protein
MSRLSENQRPKTANAQTDYSMTREINLTQLREQANYQPLTERRSFHTTVRTDTLLALIDTAEAAIEAIHIHEDEEGKRWITADNQTTTP